MSAVSDVVVLSPWIADRDVMAPLTRRDDTRRWRGAFTNIAIDNLSDLWVHDGKGPECNAWVGAFNHLRRGALLADLEALPWEDPSGVLVLVKGDGEECFGVWTFQDGRLREVPLPGWARRPRAVTAEGASHDARIDLDHLVRDQ